MGAVIGIDDRGIWIVAHATSTEQVHGKLLFVYGKRPLLLHTSGVKEFQRTAIEPVHQFEVIRMVSVGYAQSVEAPSVLDFRVKRKTVCFKRQRSAARMNFHGSRVIVTQSILKTGAPGSKNHCACAWLS